MGILKELYGTDGESILEGIFDKKCPSCKTKNPRSAKFCKNCDQPLTFDAYDYADDGVQGDVNATPPAGDGSSRGSHIPWKKGSGRATDMKPQAQPKDGPMPSAQKDAMDTSSAEQDFWLRGPDKGGAGYAADAPEEVHPMDVGDENSEPYQELVRYTQTAAKHLEKGDAEQAKAALDYVMDFLNKRTAR
jgi:hypothetical protein